MRVSVFIRKSSFCLLLATSRSERCTPFLAATTSAMMLIAISDGVLLPI